MVALVTGVAVGKLYVDSLPANLVLNTTEEELRDSEEDILKLVKKSASSRPDSFSAVELYEIAEYNFNHKDAYYKTSDGDALSVKKQGLHSTKLLRDGEYIFDNVSPGTINVITRVRHTVGTDVVTRNTEGDFAPGSGKKKGVWNDKDNVKYSVKEYTEKFNNKPLNNITYVISSKTCPQGAASKVSKASNGNYTFTIKLSGNYLYYAAIHYSYEIFYTSYNILTSEAQKKTILPAWKSMEMVVEVDSNFDFVSIKYDEKYVVNTIFDWQTVNDVFTERFYFDLKDMPTVEEALNG